MTTTLDLDPVQEAARIATQNDAFRRSILGTTPVAASRRLGSMRNWN